MDVCVCVCESNGICRIVYVDQNIVPRDQRRLLHHQDELRQSRLVLVHLHHLLLLYQSPTPHHQKTTFLDHL